MNRASRIVARLEALGLPRGVLERPAPDAGGPCLPLGVAALDARLAPMPAHACHEVEPVSTGDAPAATAFALLWLGRHAPGRPLFWLRTRRAAREAGGPYGPGLAALGFDPGRLLLVEAGDMVGALRAGRDIAAEGAAGGVLIDLIEAKGLPDLTQSRRLAFAAERPGTPLLLLRPPGSAAPSAAHSRWRIAAAPSAALEADAPGSPAFHLTLTKHRGGAGEISVRLEWDHDEASFRLAGAALPGRVAALGTGRAPRPGDTGPGAARAA